MPKIIFCPFFVKNFFRHSVPRKDFDKNGLKIIFDIFKVILFFKDLCPFLIFKLIIIKKFEL